MLNCIFSIDGIILSRLVILIQLWYTGTQSHGYAYNFTSIINSVEMNIAIITACMPVFYPQIRLRWPWIFTSSNSFPPEKGSHLISSNYAPASLRLFQRPKYPCVALGRSHVDCLNINPSNDEILRPTGIVLDYHHVLAVSAREEQLRTHGFGNVV